jgi:cell division protein FtsB
MKSIINTLMRVLGNRDASDENYEEKITKFLINMLENQVKKSGLVLPPIAKDNVLDLAAKVFGGTTHDGQHIDHNNVTKELFTTRLYVFANILLLEHGFMMNIEEEIDPLEEQVAKLQYEISLIREENQVLKDMVTNMNANHKDDATIGINSTPVIEPIPHEEFNEVETLSDSSWTLEERDETQAEPTEFRKPGWLT